MDDALKAFQFLNLNSFPYLPISQLGPPNPGTHVHSYPLIKSVQVPPFKHGSLAHSLMSIEEEMIEKQ